MPRFFSEDLASIECVKRDVPILNKSVRLIATEQKDVEAPSFWSDRALSVVVDKYFRGKYGTQERENSVFQMVERVASTITREGMNSEYFNYLEEAEEFHDDLTSLLLCQKLCFNSPVWFNVGWKDEPQVSACFLLDVEDDMEDILEHARTEIDIFRSGSGSGVNLSKLRSKGEPLSHGGVSSGLVSFNRVFDNAAAVIQSGGQTRRAARMVFSEPHHPEILEFIRCKAVEEEKAFALRSSGYDVSFGSDTVELLQWQNANLTIKVSDEFMEKATGTKPKDCDWETRYIVSGEVANRYYASDILDEICKAAWRCGDPGMAFDSALQRNHTCPSCGPIRTSNPCGEFVHNTDTSCNLVTLNLLHFFSDLKHPKLEEFKQAVRVAVISQDILISFAGFPHPDIKKKTLQHRPIGLNFCNLGSVLIENGLAYSSVEGRKASAKITALMQAYAIEASSELAYKLGIFDCFGKGDNSITYTDILNRQYSDAINLLDLDVSKAWNSAMDSYKLKGIRNSQLTLLAPTGTVSFFLDSDTTGIEPAISLVSHKMLVGGGSLTLVNKSVEKGLKTLNYSEEDIKKILSQIASGKAPEDILEIEASHLPVFDTAFRQGGGTRCLSVEDHIEMMAACQPFLSGAISKTVNLPESATPEDFRRAYTSAWKKGLKCVAVYRDNSKATQPLSSGSNSTLKVEKLESFSRKRLPDERKSITHKFDISGHEGYLHVGLYEDGKPGELFITMAKEGGVLSGMMDSFATSVSLNLQYGVPIKVLVDKFTGSHFEPYGWTANPEIRNARSIVDYIFRWIDLKFSSYKEGEVHLSRKDESRICLNCGGFMNQTKSNCFVCSNCSSTYGGCG